MKTFLVALVVIVFNLTSVSHASGMVCDAQTAGGDAWPWSVAKPFPWDNIQGYWKLGDDMFSFLNAKILSTTNNRKILALYILDNGVCSKPYAKGTGYVDITDKNVVRALITDGVYKYQLKLGMFDSRDISSLNSCSTDVMALSLQVIDRVKKSNGNTEPLDPNVTQTRNIVLKKVSIDVDNACNRVN